MAAGAHLTVQGGSTYQCFVCGAPARGLRYWVLDHKGGSPLDAYATHSAIFKPRPRAH